MTRDEVIALERKAAAVRGEVIDVAVRNGAGHIAPSLSTVEILTVLYYRVMRYDRGKPMAEDRDRFVLSKGHGCYALYAILADLGLLPRAEWAGFNTEASSLAGCCERRPEYGLEASGGSLGHGLAIATGIALGALLQGRAYHTFCLVGDGETQEGTTWEALQFAMKRGLGRLVIIVDHNRLQAMDFTVKIMDRTEDDVRRRFEGFGAEPVLVKGHDVAALTAALEGAVADPAPRPKVVIAETIKGYGLRCMENVPKFHFRVPTAAELGGGGRDGGV